MTRAYPVTPQVRESILAGIRAGKGRNEIARELQIAGAYVTGVAKDIGHSWVEAAINAEGRQARLERLAAARERIEEALLAEAEQSLEDMHAPAELHHYQARTEHDSGGWRSLTLPEPSFQDRRALMTVVGIGVQRATELGRATTAGANVDSGAGILDRLADVADALGPLLRAQGVDPTELPSEATTAEDMLAQLGDGDDEEGQR